MRNVGRYVAAGLLLAAAFSGSRARAAGDSAATRETMRRVFDALATLLPASLDAERFGDASQRDARQLAFERLARSTDALAGHGAAGDTAFHLLSRSLAADAEDAADRFARGHTAEAAFRVGQLTQRCVGCHSRLPSAREFPMAEMLLERVDPSSLPPEDRARLLVATRRFRDALSAWEAMLAEPSIPPVALDQGGVLIDYLTIAIRVEGDLERPERALQTFAARSDTPRHLRRRLLGWTDALRELRAAHRTQPPIERAALLAARSQWFAEFPMEGDGLVLDLYASALLHQEVAARTTKRAGSGPDPELARAYWLLGVIEDRATAPAWLPQTELYMEASLRSAPTGPTALRAYERIEETLLLDYGAMRIEDLPETAQRRLENLRRLMGETPAAEAGRPSP